MASDFYRKRIAYIADRDLSPDQTMAECVTVLALGLDQLMDEIQAVRHLIVVNERTRRGLPS